MAGGGGVLGSGGQNIRFAVSGRRNEARKNLLLKPTASFLRFHLAALPFFTDSCPTSAVNTL
jgi:hypothetical protein